MKDDYWDQGEDGPFMLRHRWLSVDRYPSRPGGVVWEHKNYWNGSTYSRPIAVCPNEDALYAAKRLLGCS